MEESVEVKEMSEDMIGTSAVNIKEMEECVKEMEDFYRGYSEKIDELKNRLYCQCADIRESRDEVRAEKVDRAASILEHEAVKVYLITNRIRDIRTALNSAGKSIEVVQGLEIELNGLLDELGM